MISESQTRYGSARSPANGLHGRARRCRSYHASKRSAAEAGTDSLAFAGAEDLMQTGLVRSWQFLHVVPVVVMSIHVFLLRQRQKPGCGLAEIPPRTGKVI